MKLNIHHNLYLERLKAQVRDRVELDKIPEWLCNNTSHPTKDGALWTFKNHEYQIEILSDTSDEVVAQKCSQVGASEIWVRMVLALMVMIKKINLIYVLPTSSFAKNFSKSRVDPIIHTSKALGVLLKKDVDSTELKQIGNSFLHIKGSFGQGAAISVPANALFQDEVDFCNPVALSTFNSRLGHAGPGEYFKRSFSTPTVPGYGINAMYDESSQAVNTVYCRNCKDQVEIRYMEDVVIPGFDGSLMAFEKSDLNNPEYAIDDAFVRCNQCSNPLHMEDIINPEKRKWVHKFPNRSIHGYQIIPLDVPLINPIPRTLRQLEGYERKKDWVNFKVGYAYEDAETCFLAQTIKNFINGNSVPRPEDGDTQPRARNTVFGLDVGKISWFTVYQKVAHQQLVIYAERIVQDGNNYLGTRVNQLIKVFGCALGVVDAQPDISVAKYLVDSNPHGKVWACYYSRSQAKQLSNVTLSEADQVVSAYRTGCFDDLAKKLNSGLIRLTRSKENDTMLKHLGALKRVDQVNNAGEKVSHWYNSGEDHYGHSLNYANIAFKMLTEDLVEDTVIAVHPGIRAIRMKSSGEEDRTRRDITDPLSFGMRTGRG